MQGTASRGRQEVDLPSEERLGGLSISDIPDRHAALSEQLHGPKVSSTCAVIPQKVIQNQGVLSYCQHAE